MEQREGNYETFITRTLATEMTKVKEKQMTMTTIVILVVYNEYMYFFFLFPFLLLVTSLSSIEVSFLSFTDNHVFCFNS